MKPLNIVVSTHDPLHPIRGGGALRTLKCAEEFKKRGHNVIIIAPTDGTSEISGIRVHWLHAPRKHRSQILSSLKFNLRLLKKFLRFAFTTDVFFVHNTISAAFLPFLKPIFRFTFVLDITDIHAEYLTVGKPGLVERLLTPALLSIEYWIIRAADRIIVETEAMERQLVRRKIPPEKITVVYDGSDSRAFRTEKTPDAERSIIHFGTIDKQHGVEYLIQAIPEVVKSFPRAMFYIVGGGRQLPAVRDLAETLDVSANCVFTDYLPCDKAREYLSRAAIGVIPRPDNLPNRIVTTLKIYEYWSSRTAVISSHLEGIAEIAADRRDVLFFTPGRPDDLAEKIIMLLSSPELQNALQKGGLQTVRHYEWDDLIPRIVDFALS